MGHNYDLSKPFIKTFREGKNIIVESNLPNDQHGDFAFEWDLDGSQRKRWDNYIKKLESAGIRGNLIHIRSIFEYNSMFDEPDTVEYPLSSYKMLIIDYGK